MNDRILQGYLSAFAVEYGLTTKPESEVFEAFANYCVLASEHTEGIVLDDVSTGRTRGIDGLAILVNDTLVTNPQEIEALTKKRIDVRFVFTQAKSGNGFDSGELLKFLVAVEEFFHATPPTDYSQEMLDRFQAKEAIYTNSIRMDAPPNLELFYAMASEVRPPSQIDRQVEDWSQRLRDTSAFSTVEFTFLPPDRLKKVFSSIKRRITRQITFDKRVTLPKIAGVEQSYIGILSAKEYLKLICDDDGRLQRGLFYDNVRDFQGDNSVNLEISETLQAGADRQEDFVLLNNGVTVVAREIRVVGADVRLSDFQVVNGCQTSHVLYARRDILSDSVCLVVKLVATSDADIAGLITKATNRQTQVTVESFEALNRAQKDLESYYSVQPPGPRKLFYERRSKQYEGDSSIVKTRVISLAAQIKCFVAVFMAEPHSVHRYYGELLSAYKPKSLFSEEHELSAYFASAYALFVFEEIARTGIFSHRIRRAKYHLIAMFFRSVAGTIPRDLRRSKEVVAYCERVMNVLDDRERSQAKYVELAEFLDGKLSTYSAGEDPTRLRDFSESVLRDTRDGFGNREADQLTREASIVPDASRELGTIVRVSTRGFGFILGSSGREFFVHVTEFSRPDDLQVGVEIFFKPVAGFRGPKAIDVRRAT